MLYFCFRSIWLNNDLEHVSHVALCCVIIFTMFELRHPIRSWLITFCCWYLTPRCDLDLFILKLCSASLVMWLNSLPILRGLEQSATELSRFKDWKFVAVRHLEFNRRFIVTIRRSLRSYTASECQIVTQSGKGGVSYWWFNKFYRAIFSRTILLYHEFSEFGGNLY